MSVTRRNTLAALAMLALAACSGASPGADPASTIQTIYTPYIEDRNPPDLLSAAPWTPEMRALLEESLERSQDGEPIIDFDPFIDGQDWQIDTVAVTLTSPPNEGRSEVTARFVNAGEDVQVVYEMREADGGWRIDNIRTEHWSLRALLADQGIAPSAN